MTGYLFFKKMSSFLSVVFNSAVFMVTPPARPHAVAMPSLLVRRIIGPPLALAWSAVLWALGNGTWRPSQNYPEHTPAVAFTSRCLSSYGPLCAFDRSSCSCNNRFISCVSANSFLVSFSTDAWAQSCFHLSSFFIWHLEGFAEKARDQVPRKSFP